MLGALPEYRCGAPGCIQAPAQAPGARLLLISVSCYNNLSASSLNYACTLQERKDIGHQGKNVAWIQGFICTMAELMPLGRQPSRGKKRCPLPLAAAFRMPIQIGRAH